MKRDEANLFLRAAAENEVLSPRMREATKSVMAEIDRLTDERIKILHLCGMTENLPVDLPKRVHEMVRDARRWDAFRSKVPHEEGTLVGVVEFLERMSRLDLLADVCRLLKPACCHVTGDHDPRHYVDGSYVCFYQKADAFDRVWKCMDEACGGEGEAVTVDDCVSTPDCLCCKAEQEKPGGAT